MVLEGVVSSVLNQVLSAYVENFNPKQLNVGIWGGDIKLKDLKLKRGALDKFRLPVDVLEGSISSLVLTVPWTALGSRPVKAVIENIYLLAVPASESQFDSEEDEIRKQASKMEKLKNSELLLSPTAATSTSSEEANKNESFVAAMTNKILDNLQLRIKNVHIRYEDNLSVPGHPFSVGFTLAELSAVSTDENWQESFIVGSKTGVHKLTKLDSLAIYFNTDSISLANLDNPEKFQEQFTNMIARTGDSAANTKTLALPDHQYALKPVSGEGKLILRKQPTNELAKINCELAFEELAFLIDADQYRDALSCLDLFHFYTRHREYLRFRPSDSDMAENKGKALWSFALAVTKHEVHQRACKWSWDYFRQRRDDRKMYIPLFKALQQGTLPPNDPQLMSLEQKLDYQDIRLYRSLARSEMRKEKITATSNHVDTNATPNNGWMGWIWGASTSSQGGVDSGQTDGVLSEEDKKQLYDAIEWDEREAASSAIDLPRDAILMNVRIDLKTGSFTLRSGKASSTSAQGGLQNDIISLIFDGFSADALQRTDNMELSLSLGGFRVYDGTVKNSKHPLIVKVKERQSASITNPQTLLVQASDCSTDNSQVKKTTEADPFFFLKFEHKPLDGRADSGVTLNMRHLEIVYHPSYLEDVVKFFRPPASQLESVGALIDVASSTLEGIRQDTRAGLEFALQAHKTIDIKVDMNAPIIIIPQDVTRYDCHHIILDVGHIAVSSNLVSKDRLETIKAKQNRQYTNDDYVQLESMMYDQFHVELEDTQLLLGKSFEQCLVALDEPRGHEEVHLIERISMRFDVFNCMVDNAPNLTRFKIQGNLPQLRVNFSDRKYKIVMSMIDVALPSFKAEAETPDAFTTVKPDGGDLKPPPGPLKAMRRQPKQAFRMSAFFLNDSGLPYELDEEVHLPSHMREVTNPGEEEEFFEAPDLSQVEQPVNFRQNNFQLQFTVGKLILAISKAHEENGQEQKLVDSVLEGFYFGLSLRNFDLAVEITLSSMYIADRVATRTNHMYPAFKNLVTSEVLEDPHAEKKDLVKFKYTQVQADHPEFMTLYEGIGKSVDADLSTINLVVTRPTILELFDWIMNTFTDSTATQKESNNGLQSDNLALQVHPPASETPFEKIRVKVKMTTMAFLFNEDGNRLATLSLSSGDVSLLLNGPTMRVNARLGSLTLEDDTAESKDTKFRRLVEIQGDDLANFQYETFLKGDGTYPGHDSMVYLRSGSIQFTLVETIWHRILVFFSKFAQMKAVMDAASAAARHQANDLSQTNTTMHFDILIRTPIIIFPRGINSTDSLIAYLGEIHASNSFSPDDDKRVSTTKAGLHNIRLTSELSHEGKSSTLEILGDVNIDVVIASFNTSDRSHDGYQGPDSDIVAHMSDVKINITQPQYFALLALASSVPKIFDLSELNQELISPNPVAAEDSHDVESKIDSKVPKTQASLPFPKPDNAPGIVWSTMELAFTVTNVTLELFDATITPTATLRNNSLAKFSLNGIRAQWKSQSDGSMMVEIVLKALRTIDTRTWKATKFREIIPIASHDSDQLALSYKQMATGTHVNLELDSPNFILSLDFLFALQAFLTDSTSHTNPAVSSSPQDLSKTASAESQPTTTFHYSVNVTKPKLTIISDPEKSDSDSVHLIIEKFSINQQQVLTAMILEMCMSLGTMNDRQSGVKFLDPCTMSFSWADVPQDTNKQTSVQAHTTPLILRLSYKDFLLVYSVYCKALDFSQVSNSVDQSTTYEGSNNENKDTVAKSSLALPASSHPNATSNTEKLSVFVDKVQIVLIGDLHELPLLDFHTREFELTANNWSTELSLDTSVTFALNYYNLANSHWEPLMEPWPMSFQMSRLGSPAQTALSLLSKTRLELNLTATFIDLFMTGADIWGREGENLLHRKRGVTAPYLIKNFTGYSIKLWAESDDGAHSGKEFIIEDGKDLPWRFEDWKSTRENVSSSSQHTLGLVLQDAGWTSVGGISVVREGDDVYPLRPSIDKVTHRLLCHVEIKDNVKVVTFRSTFQVQNDTLLPIEMGVINNNGTFIREPYRIAPGGSCSIPIQAAYHQKIKIRPASPKNEFSWCSKALGWTDLVKEPVRSILCETGNRQDPPHIFSAATIYDQEDSTVRYYPKITLRLRAPIEIENLLPFDINCTVHLHESYCTLLKKGELFPVHIVNVMDLMLLGIEFKDDGMVGMKSQYAVVNTNNPEDVPLENRMSVMDEGGLTLKLGLHYMRYPLSGGAFKVQIYSPYVVINKTGLDFSINTKPFIGRAKQVAGQNLCGNASRRKEPRPLLFSHLSDDKRNRAIIRVGDSNWSKGINFDVVGANQQVTMQTSTKTSEYRVGLTVSEGLGKYKLTKVVVIYPRFIIKNEADLPICLREDVSDQMLTVKPGKRALLSLFMKSTDPQLVAAFESPMGRRWTKPFPIQNVGKVYIRARDPQNEETLVHAEILLQGPSIFIKINVNRNQWPFLFRNQSSSVLHFGQTINNNPTKENFGVIKLYESRPNTETPYAWDDPAAGLQSLIRVVLFPQAAGSSSRISSPFIMRDVHVFEVGQLEPVRTHKSGQKLAFDVIVEGQAQVVVISDYNEATNVWKLSRKNGPGLPTQPSGSSSSVGDAGFEPTTVDPIVSVSASISLEGIGISIIDKRMRELIYGSFRGINITYAETQLQHEYGILIYWIQLDNQLNGALFPVLFRPTDLSVDPKALETHPNLQIQANVVKDDKHGVVYIKYATVLLQKMSLEMDESFVIALMGFSKFSGASWNQEPVNQLITDPTGIPEPASEGGGLDLYFELLHLQPLVIVISFERQESIDVTERTFDSRNPLYFLLNAVTMAIGTISGAPLTLNQLKIENARMSQGQLVARLIQHYQNEGLSQLYRVLASADFLGNPAGLFSNVSSGVQDLFYEPYHGVVLHGGSELGVGIARGATSLVKKSAFGVTDSVSKITGSVSKGLSAATLDSDWARERQRRQFRNRNKINGLATGTSAFLNSLASGIQGVAMKPIQGAEHEGAIGFFKGVGKGLVGVVAKPAVGTFDFLSNVSGGLRNATTVFDPSRGGRCRLPRHISYDGILRPYSSREAQGQDWLRSADNGKLYFCKYVAHVELPNDKDSVCVLTTDRIVMLQVNKLTISWQVLLPELKEIKPESIGIRLILKEDHTKPLIALADGSTRSWFGQHINRLLKDYHDKQRRAAGGNRNPSS